MKLLKFGGHSFGRCDRVRNGLKKQFCKFDLIAGQGLSDLLQKCLASQQFKQHRLDFWVERETAVEVFNDFKSHFFDQLATWCETRSYTAEDVFCQSIAPSPISRKIGR